MQAARRGRCRRRGQRPRAVQGRFNRQRWRALHVLVRRRRRRRMGDGAQTRRARGGGKSVGALQLRAGLRRERLRRTERVVVMMVVQRWLGPWSVHASALGGHGAAVWNAFWAVMLDHGLEVVHKQGVELRGDALLVCHLERAFERDPSKSAKSRLKGWEAYQTPFRCIGPILTTLRLFSLLRIPSLLPRVMPATLSSLVPLTMWLSARQ